MWRKAVLGGFLPRCGLLVSGLLLVTLPVGRAAWLRSYLDAAQLAPAATASTNFCIAGAGMTRS